MAMNENGLSDRVMAALTANGFTETEQNRTLADAIAKAVIDEIKANMATTIIISSGSSAGTYIGTSK